MRILYSHRIHSRDGQSVHVEELVSAFRANGDEVLVVGPPFYKNTRVGEERWIVTNVRRFLPTILKECAELLYNLVVYYHIYRVCRRFSPDLIYERYGLYLLAGSWLARRTGLPFYLEVNSPLVEERTRYGHLRLKSFARLAEHFAWRSATRVFVVTTALKNIVVAAGVDQGHVHVVSNGVVLDRFGRPEYRSPRDSITLGFVGFLRSWHGLDGVVEAMSNYSGTIPLKLVVVGDGPARAELEILAATLGLSKAVEFTGVVPFDEVPKLIAKFDIALQPKVVPYASPLKIFDYMAAGLAIVAPNQPNIQEILQHRVTALLFDPGSKNAMWQAIIEFIESPDLIKQIGTAARSELVAKDYTWKGNAERIMAWATKDIVNFRNRPN